MSEPRTASTSPWWHFLLPCALVAVAGIPVVRGALPAMGTLYGPLAWIAATASAVVALRRRARSHPHAVSATLWSRPRVPSMVLLLAISAASLLVGLFYAHRIPATGDEPHYLVMAQSLWQEHDLFLPDNMERRDFAPYSNGFQPHYGRPRRDGSPFPSHSPGLPFLLAPAMAFGGRQACIAVLSALLGALAAATYLLTGRLSPDEYAARSAALIAVSPPLFFFGFHVYAELPSALAMTVALVLLTASPGVAGAAGAALAASLLPWLHLRLVPAALILGGVGLWRLRGRALWVFIGVAALAALSFFGFYYSVFGVPLPLSYGHFPPRGFRSANELAAIFGLWLDRKFGLLPVAPVFLLGLSGLARMMGQDRRRQGWPLLLLVVSVVAIAVLWRMWWGGQCPPGRMLAPILPLLAAAAGLRCAERPTGLARWRGPLLAVSGLVALFMIASPGRPTVVGTVGDSRTVWPLLAWGTPLDRYLPNLVRPTGAEWGVTLIWLLVLGSLLALDRRAGTDERVDRWFRSPVLPSIVWLAAAACIDLCVRGWIAS